MGLNSNFYLESILIMPTSKFEFEDVDKAKKEYEVVSHVLRYVLGELKTPLSVSFLNTVFSSKYKNVIKPGITLDFMKLFKNEFMFNVIGSDIKVQIKGEPKEPFNTEYQGIAENVFKIFLKDSLKLDNIKEKMLPEKSMLFDKFCKDFSSNKYSISLPSVNRNSHNLKLKPKDGKTYVEISGDNDIFIDEIKLWEIIESQGFEELILQVLKNLFRKFYCEIDQGTLQACFPYDITIDRAFVVRHGRYFDRVGLTKLKLKEEYREPNESLATTTSATATRALEDKDIVPCADNLKQYSQETKRQDITVGISSARDSSDTKVQSSSVKNSDTESEDELLDTNFIGHDSERGSKNVILNEVLGNEIWKVTEEELGEKDESPWSDKEAVSNDNGLGGANDTTKSKEKVHSAKDMDVKDESNGPGLIPSPLEEKNSKKLEQIKNAIETKRSIIVIGENDMEPLVIDFTRNTQERRQKWGKIGVYVIKKLQE